MLYFLYILENKLVDTNCDCLIEFHLMMNMKVVWDERINTEKTKVTSLRINEDIYNLIKERAVRDKCSISDIVNKSLMDYLNNYL